MKIIRRLLLAALALLGQQTIASAQGQYQFPTSPWGGFAPARIQCGVLKGANFNVTTDQGIPISVPTVSYMIDAIEIGNPSVSLTTAAGGFYSATSKGGIAIVANTQVYTSLTTAAANATGNAMLATLATAGNTTAFQGFGQTARISTIYLSLTTGQGTAATADIRVFCRPLYDGS